MTIEKKLESLLHVGDLCTKLQENMYYKIQDHYNLSDKDMKHKWLMYQFKSMQEDSSIKLNKCLSDIENTAIDNYNKDPNAMGYVYKFDKR